MSGEQDDDYHDGDVLTGIGTALIIMIAFIAGVLFGLCSRVLWHLFTGAHF